MTGSALTLIHVSITSCSSMSLTIMDPVYVSADSKISGSLSGYGPGTEYKQNKY